MKYATAKNTSQGQRFESSWVTQQMAVWLHYKEGNNEGGSLEVQNLGANKD
ncbi:hypothetical protein [Clostridium sp.]|uniref:hypothetical protein n=1 Tax=Clostridium sp. TaxID=1506 RepID=UPI003F6638BB